MSANITNQLSKLVEKSKADRKLLVSLKTFAVKSQSFELAHDLRELEVIHFPDTEEIAKLREKAILVKTIFELAGMHVDEKTAMKVDMLMNIVNELGGKSSVNDVVEVNHFIDSVYPEI
jgi:hypothetical protein